MLQEREEDGKGLTLAGSGVASAGPGSNASAFATVLGGIEKQSPAPVSNDWDLHTLPVEIEPDGENRY